jgi:hypothetical protein
MYALVNFRGVTPIFLLAVWDMKIPPRFQVFYGCFHRIKSWLEIIWDVGVSPNQCSALSAKNLSVHHVFFDCIVSRSIYLLVEKMFNHKVEKYLDIASRWLCNKKFLQFNFISSDVLWRIWNSRNSLVFNRLTWLDLKHVWRVILSWGPEKFPSRIKPRGKWIPLWKIWCN